MTLTKALKAFQNCNLNIVMAYMFRLFLWTDFSADGHHLMCSNETISSLIFVLGLS
ncbi:hypothetical protein CCP2SC5_680016 [Azospirillaceae bacterium]